MMIIVVTCSSFPAQPARDQCQCCVPAEPRPAHPLGQQDEVGQQVWICPCSLLLMKHSTGETLQIVCFDFALLCIEFSREWGIERCLHQTAGKPSFWGKCPADPTAGG